MVNLVQASVRNRLLAALTPADFELLRPHLKLTAITVREQLVAPGEPIENTWFIESGIVSVIVEMPDGRQAEVGLVGAEGFIDVATVNGIDASPLNCLVQVGGEAWRIKSADLRRALDTSATLRAVMHKFVQTLLMQISSTAFASAANTIEERLARWLLMASDRVPDDDAIMMTHEFLSVMLGVRRTGVTLAIQSLVEAGAILGGRGRLSILDRTLLQTISHGGYGPAEDEYRRLFGVSPRLDGD